MPITVTYDATTDVAYIALRSTGPADVFGPTLLLENDRAFRGAVAADFTLADGGLVGFEIQKASVCLPAELLASAQRIDGQHLSRMMDVRVGRRLDGRAVRNADEPVQ